MPALCYLYQMLSTFRHLFSRHLPWTMFCAIILGFIGSHHIEAVTSICRFWHMDETGYHQLLHFFHSSAWCLDAVVAHWSRLVLAQHIAVTVQGRTVLLGDHTYVVKDARHMPGVVTLHQDSETQSKPTYFRGHHWGIVGLLVGALSHAFCLPLEARLHQGFAHLRQDDNNAAQRQTLALRLVHMAREFAQRHDTPALLVLDAFFAIAPVFQLAASLWSLRLKQPVLAIVTRAKKNYVAYEPAPPQATPSRGRPPKYGNKIKLTDVFETHKEQFASASCAVYGHVETVSYLALNLLWKPIKAPLRFIFARTSRGPIVLMCSDLASDPLMALALYCARVRIETLFFMLKNVLGAFAYHFWSKRLPRHSRKPKKNATLQTPPKEHLETVRRTWQACERFAMLGCVAVGLLQLVALKFHDQVWDGFSLFLRTRSRALPSERTVKTVLGQELIQNFHNVASLVTLPLMASGVVPQATGAPNDPEQELRKVVNASVFAPDSLRATPS
jgi:DDE superfamily endonuclease